MRRVCPLFLCLLFIGLCGCGPDEPAVQADGEAAISAEPKYVALTFDDGPHPGTTDVLLDGLRERNAHATFFLIGEEIAGREDLVRRMQTEGHQVGNHTWSHVRLNGTQAAITEEIQKTEAVLEEVLGEGTYWLRPPYGLVSADAEKTVDVPMVKWSVDPRDWESRDAGKVAQVILANVQPNSIILLHDIYQTSVDAALEVIDTLHQEGYQFVTVEELLDINGVTPELGVLYCRGTG
ncbi:MAG TPA: polysaccharide deacetylase family protein [Candidatus Onthomonas avicola]|nr:polysaccharide deacetylase family protein [Candidatus Onthomonas avicola]